MNDGNIGLVLGLFVGALFAGFISHAYTKDAVKEEMTLTDKERIESFGYPCLTDDLLNKRCFKVFPTNKYGEPEGYGKVCTDDK